MTQDEIDTTTDGIIRKEDSSPQHQATLDMLEMLDSQNLRWHPISTAPKDGTWVLLSGFNYNNRNYPEDQTEDRWVVSAKWNNWNTHWVTCEFCHFGPDNATHWMELPDKPYDQSSSN